MSVLRVRMEFDKLSVELTKKLSNEIKKNEGIYFTPKSIIKQIIDFVFLQNKDIEFILEPSCGSGQFMDSLKNKDVTGIEKNKVIYDSVKDKYHVIHADFLEHRFETKFDLVIGNPPYFTIPKKSVNKRYLPFFDGRLNIYILFIIKSFELLNESGILAFVLPTNFLNCIYYNKLRLYLKEYKILDISISSEKLLETCQETCIFIIQKTKIETPEFFIYFNKIILFKPKGGIEKIKYFLNEPTTPISKLGCTMNIGTVVWNQHKDELTTDSSKTLLIYSNDFNDGVLEIQKYSNPSKKNYINTPGSTDTVLLVNRGYGTGKYKLQYCLIDGNVPYLVENHCIVIRNTTLDVFQVIINSFKNKKTNEFINTVFSNNAINIEEFLHILPIYLN